MRYSIVAIAVVAVLVALQRFESFLVPTVIGVFLALILTPIVSRLEFLGVPRGLAAASVVLMALAVLGGRSTRPCRPSTTTSSACRRSCATWSASSPRCRSGRRTRD